MKRSRYTSLTSGLSATNYTDSTAAGGTTYYYVVQASSSGGTSGNSNEVSSRPISSFTLSSVTVNGGSALQVSWGAATGASAYTLKYGTVSGTYGITVSTTATSPATVTGLNAGTTYYFMVTANNTVGTGTSVNATAEMSGTPMGAFTISSVTQPSSGQATVTYGTSAGSTAYTLKYGTTSGTYGTTVSTASSSPATVTGLANGTPYYFMVYATNGSGSLAATAEGTLTPVAAPGVPTFVVATGGIANVGLTWAAATGSGTMTYSVLRSTTSGSGYTSLTSGLIVRSYTDLTALNGTTYYYVVTATNAGGTSANSAEVSSQPISSFTLSSVTVSGGSALQVSWGAATGASAYTLKYGTVSGTYGITVSTTATSPATVTGLNAGTTYYFMVTANNTVGTGTSVNATAEMSGTPMGAFTISSVTQPTSGQATVTYGASTGSTAYTLKYGTVSGTYGTTVSTASSSPATVTGLTNGTPYYFMVYATNGSGSLAATAEGTLTPVAAPGAPTSLVATGGIANVGLTWTAASGTGTMTYSVLRSTTSGSGYTSLTSGLSATSYTDLTALNGTTYYYVVSATNAGGTSANSAEVSSRPISSFTLSSVTVNGGSALQVSWGSATGASTYTLKYGTASGTYGTTLSTTATSPTTVSSLTAGTTYYFMVTANNTVGTGTSVNATAEMSGIPMGAFTISSVTQPASGQATVTYGASAGSTAYTLKYGTVSGTYGTTVSTSAISPANVTGLTNGTAYYFMVYATNGSGSLAATAEGTLTPVAAPGAPTSLVATGGSSSIALTWANASGTGPMTYSVWRSTTSGSGYTSLATGLSVLNYSDSVGLTNGTTYYYVVTATNAGGTSANSTEASAMIYSAPTAPTGLAATPGNSGIALSWTAPSGSFGTLTYSVLRGTNSGGATSYATGVSTTTYTDSSASNGTTYYYQIQAVGPGGTSAASAEVSAKASGTTLCMTGNSPFGFGSGVVNDPYLICSAAHLAMVGSYVTGGNFFKLAASIDLTGNSTFAPIGTSGTPFVGTFDGDGYRISNWTYNQSASSNLGLFGATGSGAVIKNVNLKNFTITGSQNIGALIGQATTTTIQNCTASSVMMTSSLTNGAANMGGLVGQVSSSSSITSSMTSGTVKFSVLSGNNNSAGGLVGTSSGSNTISKSYSSVNVTSTAGGSMSGASQLGGLVGSSVSGTVTVTNSYASGTLSGFQVNGGLVGNGSSSVGYSYFSGTMNIWGNQYNGQLVASSGSSSATNYWDSSVVNYAATSAWTQPGTGYSTATMKASAPVSGGVYDGWDKSIWKFSAGSYPTLYGVPGTDAPTNLTGVALKSAAALTWTAPSGNVDRDNLKYNLLRGTSSGGETLYVSNLTSPSYTDTGASSGATYYYQVQAVNSFGTSASSSEVSVVPSSSGCGPTQTPFGGGSGSSGDPWLICSPAQLAQVNSNFSSTASFQMQANLDLTGASTFVPIASSATPFLGTFDGNGFTIANWTYIDVSADNVGLFSALGASSTVKNLNLSNFKIGAKSKVGGLFGDTPNGSATITNCSISGSAISGRSPGSIGGLAGRVYKNSTVTSSSATSILVAPNSTSNGTSNVGGLVGYLDSATIDRSFSTGYVTTAIADNLNSVGGLVGNSSAGNTTSQVKKSYSTANVVARGSGNIWGTGGLIGNSAVAGTAISDSYATGKISGGWGVGGVVGTNSYNNTTVLTNCYFAGTASGLSTGGLVAGDDWGNLTVNNSFWNATIGPTTTVSSKGTGKTTAEMQTAATFTGAGWSSSTWNMVDGSYPTLK